MEIEPPLEVLERIDFGTHDTVGRDACNEHITLEYQAEIQKILDELYTDSELPNQARKSIAYFLSKRVIEIHMKVDSYGYNDLSDIDNLEKYINDVTIAILDTFRIHEYSNADTRIVDAVAQFILKAVLKTQYVVIDGVVCKTRL